MEEDPALIYEKKESVIEENALKIKTGMNRHFHTNCKNNFYFGTFLGFLWYCKNAIRSPTSAACPHH